MKKDVTAHRRALAVFGAAFVVLFAVVAIAEGIGNPSIPSSDVILVEDVPGDGGNITKAEFDHALSQTAAQAGLKKNPKPGDEQYEELRDTAINGQLEYAWLEGLAAEMGLSVSDKEVAAELKKLKDETFQSPAEYKKFLKESKFTRADVDRQVKLQILSNEIQEELAKEAPKPNSAEVENYYDATKATQFTQQPSRDVRLIVNKDRKKAKEAREALAKDNSEKNWKKVAEKFSEDPATKANGGLQEGVTDGILEEPLNEAVFNAPEGQVEGPLRPQRGFTVFEVASTTPEEVQDLEAVESQIESTLQQQAQQDYFAQFVANFQATWTSRTFCAEGYVTERCANFKGNGHPATAPEGCYEENPEGGPPEACPAPVKQLEPAVPGSVTPLEPKGKPLPQRPRPKEEEGGEAPSGLEGLPPGAVPPTEGAPPPVE